MIQSDVVLFQTFTCLLLVETVNIPKLIKFLFIICSYCDAPGCSGLMSLRFWLHDLSMQIFSTQLLIGIVLMSVLGLLVCQTVHIWFLLMAIVRYASLLS